MLNIPRPSSTLYVEEAQLSTVPLVSLLSSESKFPCKHTRAYRTVSSDASGSIDTWNQQVATPGVQLDL